MVPIARLMLRARRKLRGEPRERALAVEPVADHPEVFDHRLRGEGPGERDVLEPAPADVAEVRLRASGSSGGPQAGLRRVPGRGDRRNRRVSAPAGPRRRPDAIRDHHRVLGHFVERDQRPRDQGIGLALVPGQKAVRDADGRVRPRRALFDRRSSSDRPAWPAARPGWGTRAGPTRFGRSSTPSKSVSHAGR